tara:strand:+ start:510 stop:1184 length:675 start_codon:yes stop_codon:yes gene_type:complete
MSYSKDVLFDQLRLNLEIDEQDSPEVRSLLERIYSDPFRKAYYYEHYAKWLKSKDFNYFMTLTYRDAPAYNKYGSRWGGAPSYKWVRESIRKLETIASEYVSPMFLVIERGKHPANLVALNCPKGQKVLDVELQEWEQNVKGRLHLHGMMRTVPLYASSFSAMWSNRYGFNKIEPINDKEKVAMYVTKYVTKELHDPEFIDNIHQVGDWGLLGDGDDSETGNKE